MDAYAKYDGSRSETPSLTSDLCSGVHLPLRGHGRNLYTNQAGLNHVRSLGILVRVPTGTEHRCTELHTRAVRRIQ